MPSRVICLPSSARSRQLRAFGGCSRHALRETASDLSRASDFGHEPGGPRYRRGAILRVPPLTIPDTDDELSLRGLPQYDAVTLFMERAAAAVSGFELIEDNRITVAHICRALEGLPLIRNRLFWLVFGARVSAGY